jgi:hypothetical protein
MRLNKIKKRRIKQAMTEQLKSKRESLSRYDNAPLRKFKGYVEDFTVDKRKPSKFDKPEDVDKKDVLFKITGMKDIIADSAFPYTSYNFIAKFSDAANSSWTILEDSVAASMGKDVKDSSVNDIVKKWCTFEREDNHVFNPDRKPDVKEFKGTVWRVIEVEGTVKMPPLDKAFSLLEGKTRNEFISVASADNSIKAETGLLSAIVSGTFLQDVRIAQMYNIDANGRYVKK